MATPHLFQRIAAICPGGVKWVGARDARVSKIWAGSNEIMKELIGRDLGL